MPDSDHRSLLEELLTYIEEREIPLYERLQSLNYWGWHFAAGAAFLCSAGTVLAAALMDDVQYKSFGRRLLIILPFVGTVFSGALHLFKFREKEALREDGRIEARDIVLCGRSLLAQARDDDACRVAFDQVRERARRLEEDQHRRDVALRNDERVAKVASEVRRQ